MADEIKVLVDYDFLNNQRPINLPAPVADGDAANKLYVDQAIDSVSSGLSWKESVRVRADAPVTTAPAPATVDGVTLVIGDRVLLTGQVSAAGNGIYEFDGTDLVRPTDADTFDELEAAIVIVEEGTSAGAAFRQTEVNGTIGVDDILWVSFGASVPLASETTAGRIEIATQAETDAGTDDARAITPLKLKNSPFAKKQFASDFGNGSAKTFTFNHNLGTTDVIVRCFENSTGEDVELKQQRVDVNTVEVRVKGSAPSINEYRIVVLG